MNARIEVALADITALDVDVIVNAANGRLLGGGGVDGAVHRAAGPGLLEACRRIPEDRPGVRCPTGEARITPGFDLPARFVIHTVGPVWQGGDDGEDETLAACYRACLSLAGAHGLTGVAFPAISTGAYGFPLGRATAIAVRTVREHLPTAPSVTRVIFTCFEDEALDAYRRALARSDATAGSARRPPGAP